ncbi:hypothetical protein RRG08_010124 [Elysia crispata]|uniref:Uncharacterized protein n=1 Tax=Elysia crispata TaxID=231223 RepID=A0AAE0Z479_9GAST|nr:hypothetical protein RRG08_010124 [Elysia crispata]
MPKRKSSIGRSTPQTRRQRAAIDVESTQDRLNRLERNIATTRLARDVESQEERESRLQRNRLAMHHLNLR